MALWANCATLPLPRQTDWQPNPGGKLVKLCSNCPPPAQSSWGRAIPLTALEPGPLENQDLPKDSPSGSFPCLCRNLALTRLPPVKALLPGMQARRVKSQNNVLPLPHGERRLVYLTALISQHGIQSPPQSGLFLPHFLPLSASQLALVYSSYTDSCHWASAYALLPLPSCPFPYSCLEYRSP